MVQYIKDLDLLFSRLITRFRILYSKHTTEEITGTQFLVLQSLRNNGPCNTSYLAQSLGVTLSAITALINRLFKLGLVTRERKARDRRQVWINITSKGLQVLKEVEEQRYLLLALYFSRLSEKERQQLQVLLRQLVELFEMEDLPGEEPGREISI